MKKSWMEILQQYKEDGFDSVEIHLKNNEVFFLEMDSVLIAEDKFIFNEKGKAILIFAEEVKEIAI